MASATRPGRPALDLMGPWFRTTPWARIWWNLNIQLAYWPQLTGNRMELGTSFRELIDQGADALAKNAGDPKALTQALTGIEKSGASLKFTYQRSLAAMGEVNYTAEWRDDLAPSWSTQGVTETINSDNGIIQDVQATIPAGNAQSRFVRLRVAGNG